MSSFFDEHYLTFPDTAYRAYTTGASSVNPQTVALAKHGATLYTIQLALNLLWTPLYFGLGRPAAATVDILALGGTIAYLIKTWGQVDPVCGWLLAPYLGWVSFATYLCVSISSIDRPLDGADILQAGSGYLNNWDFNEVTKED